MKNKLFTHIFTISIVMFLVNACSNDTKKTLGLDHSIPDESTVLKRPPLYVPPDFDLPPPKDEETSIQSDSTDNFSTKNTSKPQQVSVASAKKLTPSDKIFLTKFRKPHSRNTNVLKTNLKTNKNKINTKKALQKSTILKNKKSIQ